jgi:hypothetical protein
MKAVRFDTKKQQAKTHLTEPKGPEQHKQQSRKKSSLRRIK